MQVWVDVWDATYSQKVGNRLRPIMASYKRKLDEAGMGRATFAIDPRSLAIIQVRRIVEVWLSDTKAEWDSGSTSYKKTPYSRKLGAFVVEAISPNANDRTITVRGPGVMSNLINSLALPGLFFEDETVATVMSDLAAIAGWTVDAAVALSSLNISVRFAGENILRGLAVVAESQGVHIRESATNEEVEAGSFGAINSHAEFVKGDAGEMALRKDAPMMIKNASISEESSDVVNKVYVYGGGDGDAALTLALSDRPFVDSEVVNGRTHYFIQDAASISLYGTIARRLDVKRISSTEPTDAADVNAANALADAGKAWLDRNSMPYELLKLSVQNVNATIQPGDKTHVRYKDVINLLGVPYQERDIDEPYWVMAVEESISQASSLEVSLEVANLDRYETNAADIVVGMMDSIKVQNVNIQPYPVLYYYPMPKAPIDTAIGYLAPFVVSLQTVRLNQGIVYLSRSSWTTIQGAAGGSHRHRVAISTGTNISLTGMSGRIMTAATFADAPHSIVVPNASDDDLYTEETSGSHVHDFGEISQDDQLPKYVEITLDGVIVATDLFPDGDAETLVAVDITEQLKSGTLRGFHDIGVTCLDGRGDIYVVVAIDADVSRVRSS